MFAGQSRSNKATGSKAGGCYAAKEGTVGKHEVAGLNTLIDFHNLYIVYSGQS